MKYQRIQKYKYKLAETEVFSTGIIGHAFTHNFFFMTEHGLLFVKEGYLWDGVSGVTWDSKNTMRGGLGHDAMYQAIRLGLLPPKFKAVADEKFYQWLIREGMSKFRAGYYYHAVDKFGHFSCRVGDVKIPEILIA